MKYLPDPKPDSRVVANFAAWKKLHADCYGPCLICGDRWLVELHHLVPRAPVHGGDDVPANLVPLCRAHHAAVTERRGGARVDLRHRLRPEHVRYVVMKKSAAWLDKQYPWSGDDAA